MLWLIIKVAVFIALVGAATFGAAYLMDLEGGVRIVMAGVEINLTPIKAMIAPQNRSIISPPNIPKPPPHIMWPEPS